MNSVTICLEIGSWDRPWKSHKERLRRAVCSVADNVKQQPQRAARRWMSLVAIQYGLGDRQSQPSPARDGASS